MSERLVIASCGLAFALAAGFGFGAGFEARFWGNNKHARTCFVLASVLLVASAYLLFFAVKP